MTETLENFKTKKTSLESAYLMKNGRNGAIILTVIEGMVSASSKTPVDIMLQSRAAR